MEGIQLREKQEDGRFCRAYLRTMDPEQAAAEVGRRDGYTMLAKRATQQKLEQMRCAAADQLKREDVLRQLARLAFGRVDDAVRLALCRGAPGQRPAVSGIDGAWPGAGGAPWGMRRSAFPPSSGRC